MADDYDRPTFAPALGYRDPKAALHWLEKAFGFEQFMVILGPDGNVAHAEMRFGDGIIMVGGEWSELHRSPASVGGKNTQTVHVHLADSVDAHCARARAGGAEILMEPEDQFYGDRAYRVRDLEGHVWSFSQNVRKMTRAEWDKAGGVTTKTRV